MFDIDRWTCLPEKDEPHNENGRDHVGNGEFEYISQETRRMHFLLIRDGFDHEVGAVADVGVRSEKDRRHTDRHDVGHDFRRINQMLDLCLVR